MGWLVRGSGVRGSNNQGQEVNFLLFCRRAEVSIVMALREILRLHE